MMRNTTIRSIAFAAGIALLALAAPAPRVLAATWYWNTNTTGLWTTASNWSDNPSTGGSNPTTAPTTGDTAYFNQSSRNGATTLRLSADQSIDGLVFANTGATTITGTTSNRILTIGTVGITINSGAGAVTLGNATSGSQVAIAMGGSQTWTNNSSNTLTATNGIASTSGTQTLTIGGSGATALGGIIADGAAGNRVSITKQGAGNLTLSAANTFTGPVTINSGTLTVTSAIGNGGVAGGLGQSTSDAANLVINGGVLNWNTASAETTNRGITIGTSGGTILSNNNGNNGLTLTGSLALAGSGARTITLTSVASNRSNSWSADIGDSGGATAVIVNNTTANGGSSWALSGNLTFTGGLSVTGGGGVLSLTGTRNNFSGGVTIGGGSRLNLSTDAIVSNYTFSQDITNNGTLSISPNNNTGSLHTISGLISGSGSVSNTLVQNGTIFLSNANNSYTGRTWMSGNGAETTVRVSKLANGGQNSGIGASTSAAANLEIGGNVGFSNLEYVGVGDSTDRLFTIKGNGGFRAGILNNGSGPLSFTNTGTIPFATANTINTFILGGTNTGNNTFAPVVTDNGTARVSFTKGGAGTWVLTGNNTFSGTTTIGAGSLGVATVGNAGGTSNLGASGTINFGATTTTGTLVYTGAGETSDKVINLAGTTGGAGIQADNASGTLIFSNNLTVTGSGAKTLTLSGSGAGQLQGIIPNYTGAGGPLAVSVTKSGNGTWRLSGANSYTGATTVSAGVLRLDAANALPGGIASTGGSSALTINGGVIGLGNGDFTRGLGSGTNQVQITGGGGFAAYGADRTVNLGGNGTPTSLTWGSGSFITTAGGTFVLGAASATNMVDFQNPIALGAAVRTVQVDNGSADVDGTLSGVLSSVSAGNGLTKTGLGTLDLTAANSFNGTLAVQNGTVRFTSLAAVSSAQNLGAGTLVNLGVAGTSAGELDYRGSGGTLGKNITALGSGRNRIRNSGGGSLALTGTLTKNGTILELAGGTFNVSGLITGANANSDLFVNGASVTLSNTNNDYNGPTYVYGGGSLTLGASNVIPNGSPLILGGTGSDTGTGTFDLQSSTESISSLTFGSGGGTVKMAANQTASPQLSTASSLTLGSNASLDLTGMQTSAGNYRLISSTVISGTFGSVSGLNSNYLLRYGTVNANEISAQRKAEFGTITATPAVATIITGGSTAFGYTVANATPAGGSTLSFTSSNGSNVAGSSSGSAAANATSSSISGLVFTGTSVGLGQTGSFTLTDPDAIGSPAAGSVTVNVLNHSLASFDATNTATKTLNFGTFDGTSWTGGDGGDGSLAYSIYNIKSLGFTDAETAGLNFWDWDYTSGDDVFDIGFSSFANLASGTSTGFSASVLSPGTLSDGLYTATYTLKFRDQQNLAGAADTRSLTITMSANVVVVPEPGAIALAGIGIAAAAYALRRRK